MRLSVCVCVCGGGGGGNERHRSKQDLMKTTRSGLLGDSAKLVC